MDPPDPAQISTERVIFFKPLQVFFYCFPSRTLVVAVLTRRSVGRLIVSAAVPSPMYHFTSRCTKVGSERGSLLGERLLLSEVTVQAV